MKINLASALLAITVFLAPGLTAEQTHAQEAGQKNRLSSQQKDEILRVRSNADQALVSNIEQLQALKVELSQLMISETASESEIQEKYLQIRAISQAIMDSEFQARLTIRNILPPELRAPFAQQLNAALRNASANPAVEN